MVRTFLVASLLSCSVAFAAPATAPSKIDPAKAADIRMYMKLTGAGDIGKQVLTQIMSGMRQQMTSVPPAFWDEFAKEVNTDELMELLVPIYDKHLTREDLKVLNDFYQTPTGKKFVHELPGITQDSMAVGSDWGRKLGERVMEKMNKQQSKAK